VRTPGGSCGPSSRPLTPVRRSRARLRFHPLRMHETLVKSDPKKIIADGTDWRFLSELKQELKG
jgi:hypothetical protein